MDVLFGWLASPWFWWAFALALFAAEALLPGAFMVWLGLAAGATGFLSFVLPGDGFQAELIAFSLMAGLAIWAGVIWKRLHGDETEQPLLNRRADSLVGQVYPLAGAIIDGRGKLKIGDALWTATGPDLPLGERVRIVSSDGVLLAVTPE